MLAWLHPSLPETGSLSAADLTLAWDQNSEPDVAGYRLYYGTPPGVYSTTREVLYPTNTAVANNLQPGATYAFYVTCFNTSGLESEPSNIVEYPVPGDSQTNAAPSAESFTNTVVAGQSLTVTLRGTDPDGDTLSYALLSFPTLGAITAYTNASVTYQTPGVPGVDHFTYTVHDGHVVSAPATVTLVVQAQPNPVSVIAGPDQVVTLPALALLQGRSTNTTQVTWALADGPAPVTFSARNELTTQVRFTQPGLYTLRLVGANGLSTATNSLQVTVNALHPDERFTLFVEAESGSVATPMYTATESTPAAPGTRRVTYVCTYTEGGGTADFELPHLPAGDFILWCRVRTVSSARDSFYVSIDGDAATEDIYDASFRHYVSTWQWTPLNGRGGATASEDYAYTINPRVFSLTADDHWLRFRGFDRNAQLDALVLTNDPDFDPLLAETAVAAPILTAASTTAPATLTWSSIPGRRYQIAFTEDLASPWTLRTGEVQAPSTLSTWSDPSPGLGQRYYQILLLP